MDSRPPLNNWFSSAPLDSRLPPSLYASALQPDTQYVSPWPAVEPSELPNTGLDNDDDQLADVPVGPNLLTTEPNIREGFLPLRVGAGYEVYDDEEDEEGQEDEEDEEEEEDDEDEEDEEDYGDDGDDEDDVDEDEDEDEDDMRPNYPELPQDFQDRVFQHGGPATEEETDSGDTDSSDHLPIFVVGAEARRQGRSRTSRGFRSRVAADKAAKKMKQQREPRAKPRPAVDPGKEYKELHARLMEAFIEKDYVTAVDFANKAIQLNPEIFVTHNILAQAYEAMGDKQKSLETLLIGARIQREKELWFRIITKVQEIDAAEYPFYTREVKIGIILDCLRNIISIDSNDYDARGQKLQIEIELGNNSRAVALCRRMLQIRPNDVDVLQEMARLGSSSLKMVEIHNAKILESFEASIDYFLANESYDSTRFDFTVLNFYIELLERAGDYTRALSQLKVLSRWLLGRATESYWNEQEDDREWDNDHEPRRVLVPEFDKNRFPKECYGEGLPLDIRVKMGICRLRCGHLHLEEALDHFRCLDPDAVSELADLFGKVADELASLGYYAEAMRFYEPLWENCRQEMTIKSFIGLHSCFEHLHKAEGVAECRRILSAAAPEELHDIVILAKYFEDIGSKDETLRWGTAAYKGGGLRHLRRINLKALPDIQALQWIHHRRNRRHHRRWLVPQPKPKLRPLAMAPSVESGFNNAPAHVGPVMKSSYLIRSGIASSVKPRTTRRRRVNGEKGESRKEPEETAPLDTTGQDDAKIIRAMLNRLAEEFPDDLRAAQVLDRELRANIHLMDDLLERAEEGEPCAFHTWIVLAKELINEFVDFQLFYYNYQVPFTTYFRRAQGGGLWKEAALVALATFANKVEEEGDDTLEVDLMAMPTEFHGIPFETWIDVFCQYALALARQGDSQQCFRILNKVCEANVFYHNLKYLHQSYICRMACGIVLDDSKQVAHCVRWMMKKYPFSSDIFRLYHHNNRLCSVATDYNTNIIQKTILRFIKAMDHAMETPEEREQYASFVEHGDFNTEDQKLSNLVRGHDPTLLGMFAHILMAGGTYISALNYYFRAFAVTPDDPVLNLCIAVCYTQHAMKRQSENRQIQIQQGLSFAFRYHELRTRDGVRQHCQEAEFNIGRIWHSLGLTHLAVPAYEGCLALSKNGKGDDNDANVKEDFATDAAFCLQQILALSGDFRAARQVTENHLVIE